MIRSRIVGTGHYLPKKILTNFDLEKMMNTSDEWIRQRTGISQRHIAADGEATSDLGAQACRAALERAEVDAKDVDLIICATATADYYFPSSACIIEDLIGANGATAFDLNAACSGFIYGLETADGLIRAGVHRTAIVVGSEVLSTKLYWTRRETAVLFGDGAGAVVLQAHEGEEGILTTYTGADGSDHKILRIPSGGSKIPIRRDNINDLDLGIEMDGPGLYKWAVKAFREAAEKAFERSGFDIDSIDYFIPHQANIRIIQSAVEKMKLPEEKVILNLDKVANTSAASIPIALDQAVRAGTIQEGHILLFAAFGAGLTWASAIVRW